MADHTNRNKKTDDRNSTLVALTSSALLLPAYQGVQADAPPEYTELGVRYSKYEEDDIQGKKSFGGGSERYEIDVAQFHLLAPVADSWSVALDVAWEDMSGASPWFVGESASGDPKVIMSGASIEDTRTEVTVATRYYFDRGNVGVGYTNSDEDDYESDAFSLDGAFNTADGMRTYSAAISYSDDEIDPTQGTVPTNTEGDDKEITSGYLGLSQIISKNALVRFGISYTYREGFLTDPYKFRDSRPDEREEWVFSTGYRRFFDQYDAALQVDYRYFDDDWDVVAHTLDVAWVQNIGSDVQLTPFIRYYTQEEAEFFSVVADTAREFHADDYRLSSFGAFSYGAKLHRDIGNWRINGSFERYRADESWALDGGEESPGLVDFWRYSIGLDYRFK